MCCILLNDFKNPFKLERGLELKVKIKTFLEEVLEVIHVLSMKKEKKKMEVEENYSLGWDFSPKVTKHT